MRTLAMLCLLFFLCPIAAQENKLLTPEQLKADADFYFDMLHIKHPNPYYYCSLNDFEDKKNRIYAQLDKPLTIEQFSWIIGEMNSCHDLHTRIYIYYEEHWRKDIFSKEDLLLFSHDSADIRNNKLYINDKEVSEINGIKTDKIFSDLQKIINWELPYEANFQVMKPYFPLFIRLKFNIEAPFEVKFSNSDEVLLLDGVCNQQVVKYHKETFRAKNHSYKIYPNSSIALFNITNFQNSNKDSLKIALDKFTKEVNDLKIESIFYDMSVNRGGQYIEYNLFDIVKHDSVYYKYNRIDRSGMHNKKHTIKEVVSNPNFHTATIPEKRKLFVLQGTYTVSNGDYFCRIVSENKLGILVGQNTGEPTVAFSCTAEYILPNSRIRFSVAERLYDFSDYFESETTSPDIYWKGVNTTAKDFTEEELNDIIYQWKKQNKK